MGGQYGVVYHFRRFLKKNFLIQDVGAGLIKMSYLGEGVSDLLIWYPLLEDESDQLWMGVP